MQRSHLLERKNPRRLTRERFHSSKWDERRKGIHFIQWDPVGGSLCNHEALLVKEYINRLWMVSTNTERKIEMVLDSPGYKIRCQIENRKENN